MLRIRPYKPADAPEILSWCRDEMSFYQWTAGVLGEFPITEGKFSFVEKLMPFTAFDDSGVVGFFTLRNPGETPDELRFGFVILNPEIRGKGHGKQMLKKGMKFAFECYGAERVSLGVFENNPAAYHCYRAVGFRDVTPEEQECYTVMGETWKCRELIMEK